MHRLVDARAVDLNAWLLEHGVRQLKEPLRQALGGRNEREHRHLDPPGPTIVGGAEFTVQACLSLAEVARELPTGLDQHLAKLLE